jgi:hypothetical protein
MPSSNKLTFSVTRSDLVYDYASSFEEIFKFKVDDSDVLSNQAGVRFQEALGFDFQSENNPLLQITPCENLIKEKLFAEGKEFSIYITLEDTALGIRKMIYSKNIDEIQTITDVKVDLASQNDCGFTRGYILKAFIARRSSIKPDLSVFWSKSNIIFQTEFIVKASIDEALFEIAWTNFSDPDVRKNVLMYVDWKSTEVSDAPHSECFQVKANSDLKSQFKRLENNRHFGELTIRLIADRIISELVENTLRCANLESEPMEGSLHDKISHFLDTLNIEFTSLAKRYQEGDFMDQLNIISETNRDIQKAHKIAFTLGGVKFGGYRIK